LTGSNDGYGDSEDLGEGTRSCPEEKLGRGGEFGRFRSAFEMAQSGGSEEGVEEEVREFCLSTHILPFMRRK